MKSFIIILMFNPLNSVIPAQQVSVIRLATDHKTDPTGIGNTQPGFSWIIEGTGRKWKEAPQTIYS